MRERRDCHVTLLSSTRITPAYAGKTISILCFDLLNKDHPRVCGKDSNRSPILSHSSDPHQQNFFTFVESA